MRLQSPFRLNLAAVQPAAARFDGCESLCKRSNYRLMSTGDQKWWILILVLWLPPQVIAAYASVCSETNSGIPTQSLAPSTHSQDRCDAPPTCPQLNCDHCPQCGVTAGVGVVASPFSNRFPVLKETRIPSRTVVVTSCYQDLLFKPPRRS